MNYSATISTELLNEQAAQMSRDMFLAQLKNGEVYTISQVETRRCGTCMGWGRVSPDAVELDSVKESTTTPASSTSNKRFRKGKGKRGKKGSNGGSQPEPGNDNEIGQDGKITCPTCKGSGKVELNVTYQATW